MSVIIGKLSAWQICACSINISGARFSGAAKKKKNSHPHIRFVYASRDLTVVTSQKSIYAARD